MTKTKVEIGQELERKVFDKLKRIDGMNVYANVLIPKRDGKTTEIDILAIHTSGVYIVECKNFSGEVRGSVYNDTWYQCSGNVFLRGFYNPVKQNIKHKQHFLEYTKLNNSGVRPLIVFDDRTELDNKVRANIGLMNFSQVDEYIRPILGRQILTASCIKKLAAQIEQCEVGETWLSKK